jgi:hypothetical protein
MKWICLNSHEFMQTGLGGSALEGIVKLTAVGDNRTDEILVSPPPVSTRDHRPCRLAVPSVHS